MLSVESVVAAIIEMGIQQGISSAFNRTLRNEVVLKLLHRFRLNPNNPPADFDSLYSYALIEFGVYKPESILNFFRNEHIRQAFREALYQNDSSILEREAEDVIQWTTERQTGIGIEYDPRQEFAAFTAVFYTLVGRSRQPAQVVSDNSLENLQETLARVLDRVERLSSDGLNAIRLEVARQNPNEESLGLLEAQLRGWFDALNYRILRKNIRAGEAFEWEIAVPERRGRFLKVLVIGVAGEGRLEHLYRLFDLCAREDAHEGWLLANSRISQAAVHHAKTHYQGYLYCYTIDELLEEQVNFDSFFEWIDQEVTRRKISQYYAPLAAARSEYDSVTNERIGASVYDESSGWLEGYIDRWLEDPAKEHVSILGEFGTGKTWFSLHYAWLSMQKYQLARRQGMSRPRIPLLISLKDYTKAVTVESLFSEFFFRKHEIPLPGYSAFEQLNRMGRLLIIFDGFDEMASRVDQQKMINNFWELAKVVVPGSKVMLTCRTEHFPTAQTGRDLLNSKLLASTARLTGQSPQFEILELQRLNDTQVRNVLVARGVPVNLVARIFANSQLLELVQRPMMIELIVEALPRVINAKTVRMADIYYHAIQQKLNDDILSERTFTSLPDKLYFLCEICWELLSSNENSINYRHFPDRIRRLFGREVMEHKELDHWHHDMMGQTLLIRNEEGDYSPAHRSFLDFFVAYKMVAELGLLDSRFQEIAVPESPLYELPQPYKWSKYFQALTDTRYSLQTAPNLERFEAETSSELFLTVGYQPFTKAVLDMMSDLVTEDRDMRYLVLSEHVRTTRGQTFDTCRYFGGNVITLLARLEPERLKAQDYSGTCLVGARLWGINLSQCDFTNADLRFAMLPFRCLESSRLISAKLDLTVFSVLVSLAQHQYFADDYLARVFGEVHIALNTFGAISNIRTSVAFRRATTTYIRLQFTVEDSQISVHKLSQKVSDTLASAGIDKHNMAWFELEFVQKMAENDSSDGVYW